MKPRPKTHELKCLSEYFFAVDSGEKPFEVRRDDRGFQRGDKLVLKEVSGPTRRYTGNEIERKISYILTGGQFGIEAGYVVLGLSK